jgi:3-phenylpropionate/trans-cinnamate dioxygenase ferredoxin subunit
MSFDGFQQVASLTDLPVNGKLCLELDDRYVVLVRLQEGIFCLDDVCTHDGGPLGEGELIDGCLVCPRHGAVFNVRSGQPTMPATESCAVHEVCLRGEDIFVRLKS